MKALHDHQNLNVPVVSEIDDETSRSVVKRLYRKRLLETLEQAIQTDHNGVDIVHLEQESRTGLGLNVWQATKWETEPPATPAHRCRRYDFRYYDRDALLVSLSQGEWPGP